MDRLLSSYPFVIVRIACDLCGRSGKHRLVRLGAKFGPECPLEEVLARLAADCPARRPLREISGQQWKRGCWARFPDLDGPPQPPDLPADLRMPRLVSDRDERPPGYVPRSRRNPRRAYDHNGREIEPVRIAAMIERRMKSVLVYCGEIGCGREAKVDVSSWPGEMYVPDIALHLRCGGCGKRGAARIMGDWPEWHAAGYKPRA